MTDPIPSTVEFEVREAGLNTPPQAPPVGELPAGGGKWAVPHHLSKIGLINQIARAYRWSYDEALKHSRSNAVAMLRDLDCRDPLTQRITPTVQLPWHLEAQDETDPAQMDAVKKLEGVIRQTPRLQDLFESLMWAVWYGRAGCQLTYRWDWSHPDGDRRLVVKDHKPINGDSLVAHWSGDWGVLVNGMYDGPNKQQSERGFEAFFTPAEREAVIIHTHSPADADYYEPELAGQIKGSGVRGHVYWNWWLKGNFLALAQDWAERFANGVWKAYYNETNPDSKSSMESNLAAYKNSNVLLLPRNKGTGDATEDVEIMEVSTASPAFILELVEYLQRRIEHYITGGALAPGAELNVGGDGVELHENQLGSARKADAQRLAETLTAEWIPVLTKYNCDKTVPPPKFVFEIDRPNADDLIAHAGAIQQLGGDIDLDPLYEAAGLSRPGPGSNVSSKLQPMSPVAAAQTPQEVPLAGPPGPQPEMQPQQPAVAAAPVDQPVATV